MIVREPVGAEFTDGFEVLVVEGDEPAIIRRVVSVGDDGVLEPLGALVAGPDRRYGAVQLIRGYPPAQARLGTVEDAVGFEVLPRSETRKEMAFELLVGYRAVKDEIGVREDIRVEYEVDGQLFSRSLGAGMLYCPPRFSDDECSAAADEAFESRGDS